MTLKLSDKFLMESMKKRISALEIKLGQKTSEIDEFIFRNKALKQKIKDKDLESYYKNKYSWYGKFDCYDSEDGGEALTKDEQELIRKINMILK